MSRCATLAEVNNMLLGSANYLRDSDPSLVGRLLDCRKSLLVSIDTIYEDMLQQRQHMRSRGINQEWSVDNALSLNRVAGLRSIVESAVLDAEKALSGMRGTRIWPEFDWLAVPVLSSWRLDGILYGVEDGEDSIKKLLSYSKDNDMLFNVCVEGPCPVRNQKLVKRPQFFDDAVGAGEFLYACLVAYSDDNGWQFQIKTASSRQISLLIQSGIPDGVAPTKPGGESSDFTRFDLFSTTAAWRIGRVVDERLTTGTNSRCLVDVDVQRLDRFEFMRNVVGDDSDGLLLRLLARRLQRKVNAPKAPPTVTQNKARPVPKNKMRTTLTAIEEDDSEGEEEEDKGLETMEEDEGEDVFEDAMENAEDPAPAPGRSLVIDPPAENTALAAMRPFSTNEDSWFNFGRGWLEAAAGGFLSAAASASASHWDLRWTGRRNANYPDFTNGTVAVGVSTYTLRTLAAREPRYQRQYFLNSMFLTQSGFYTAVDKFMSTAPLRSLSEYEDFCGVLMMLNDNGLTHELCKALDGAVKDGRKLFPYKMRSSPNRTSRVSMLSFKLPPQKDGTMTLGGVVDMSRFVDMAPGDTLLDKSKSISFALNFLFDLPFNTNWSTADTGITWIRSTTDQSIWDECSTSRLDCITDVGQSALAMRSAYQSSNFFLQLVLFGAINTSALSVQTVAALRDQVSGMQSQPLSLTNSSFAVQLPQGQSTELSRFVDAQFASSVMTPELAVAPFRLVPSRDNLAMQPIPPRSTNTSTYSSSIVPFAEQTDGVFAIGEQQDVVSSLKDGIRAVARMAGAGLFVASNLWVAFKVG